MSIKLSWNIELEELLDVSNVKYNQYQAFKNSLNGFDVAEINYADVDRYLGCGMN